MRGISKTITKLNAVRAMQVQATPRRGVGRLSRLTGFGSNPGALDAKIYVPADLLPGAALVVVLHGCTQDAEGYDHGAGWSQLADKMGFALLYPEQLRSNNFNLCFNWYETGDVTRGRGEVLSIRQMIETMIDTHALDRRRVFVTGLSAGGAMTSAMLACYPDVFAGGAIIAGLPYACATSVPEAFGQMHRASTIGGDPTATVRAAFAHDGPWPTLSVWHGDADRIVDPSNAAAIIEQWRGLHGVEATPSRSEIINGHMHQSWQDASGRPVIEFYSIAGVGHGVPLATRGDETCGTAGAHMLDADISSTHHIARSWELDSAGPRMTRHPARHAGQAAPLPTANIDETASIAAAPAGLSLSYDPGCVINNALRAAGLMK
ncbi:MAG: PHB depolymerase family esterase [Sphingomonadaceae bacterium]|nr:PHB depolymerase family esterase [Sphingomonadaceae bacterium]